MATPTPAYTPPPSSNTISRAQLKALGQRVVGWLAHPVSRVIIAFALAGWLGYLAYSSIYVPIREELALPGGVSQQNPELKRELLNQLETQRQQREQAPIRQFTGGVLFRPNTAQVGP